MLNPDGTKSCSRCKASLSPDHFYKISRPTGDGLTGYCKACTKVKAVEWQKANPEKKKASDSRREWKPTAEKRAAATERHKAWRQLNPEKFKANQQKYRTRLKAENPALVRARTAIQNNRARARRAGVPTDVTTEDWLLLLEAFEHSCAWCGTKVPLLDLDHIIPFHRGGHDVAGNVIPSCRPCNAQKSHSDPYTFAKLMGKNIDEIIAKAKIREPFSDPSSDGYNG